MSLVARQLARGDWVHVFPEGKVRQDGQMDALKLGTAYLVCKAAEQRRAGAASADGGAASSSGDPAVVVLPFFHTGMERVKPLKQMMEIGHDVDLRVGRPVELGDLLKLCGKASGARWPACRRSVGLQIVSKGVSSDASAAPFPYFSQKGQDQVKLYKQITDRIDKSLHSLEAEDRRKATHQEQGQGGEAEQRRR